MPAGLLLASTLLPAAYQVGQGIAQRYRAKNLKESKYIPPELLMNRDLAAQQAYSRRAPGQARSEENNRRITATAIAAGNRNAGGDANKAAAITTAATARGYDANAALQDRGQQFSENAFARMAQANLGIGAQKQRNRDDYTRTKSELIAASDQNFFNALTGAGSAGVAFGLNGGFKGQKAQSTALPAGAAGDPTAGAGFDPNAAYNNPYNAWLGNGASYGYPPGGGNPMDPNNYNPVWRNNPWMTPNKLYTPLPFIRK